MSVSDDAVVRAWASYFTFLKKKEKKGSDVYQGVGEVKTDSGANWIITQVVI